MFNFSTSAPPGERSFFCRLSTKNLYFFLHSWRRTGLTLSSPTHWRRSTERAICLFYSRVLFSVKTGVLRRCTACFCIKIAQIESTLICSSAVTSLLLKLTFINIHLPLFIGGNQLAIWITFVESSVQLTLQPQSFSSTLFRMSVQKSFTSYFLIICHKVWDALHMWWLLCGFIQSGNTATTAPRIPATVSALHQYDGWLSHTAIYLHRGCCGRCRCCCGRCRCCCPTAASLCALTDWDLGWFLRGASPPRVQSPRLPPERDPERGKSAATIPPDPQFESCLHRKLLPSRLLGSCWVGHSLRSGTESPRRRSWCPAAAAAAAHGHSSRPEQLLAAAVGTAAFHFRCPRRARCRNRSWASSSWGLNRWWLRWSGWGGALVEDAVAVATLGRCCCPHQHPQNWPPLAGGV